MQVSCLPIARATSVAATAESTPPESAHSTFASPTCARTFSIASSTHESIRHDGGIPAIVCRKFSRIAVPASVCTTSGWNSTAYTLRASSLIAAAAEVAVCASAVNPGGTLCTESPCDIQTRDSAGAPRDELADLRAEVEDDDGRRRRLHGELHHAHSSSTAKPNPGRTSGTSKRSVPLKTTGAQPARWTSYMRFRGST